MGFFAQMGSIAPVARAACFVALPVFSVHLPRRIVLNLSPKVSVQRMGFFARMGSTTLAVKVVPPVVLPVSFVLLRHLIVLSSCENFTFDSFEH